MSSRLPLWLCPFLLSVVMAQEPAKPETPPAPQSSDTKAAIEAWLASGMAKKDEALQTKAVGMILKDGEAGLKLLADVIKARPKSETPDDAEKKQLAGLDSLLRATCLQFWQAQVRTNIQYAGQYDPLRVLQPYAGKLFLTLVIEPPQWFPTQSRDAIVRVLRDIYPDGPAPEAKTKLLEIAKDEDFEPDRLRTELAYALAQWNDRTLLDKRIKALEERIASGKPDEQVKPRQELADVYYQVRDYVKAAELHKQYLRSAEEHKLNPNSNDYYNAACNLSLAGDVDGALAELERCIATLNDDTAKENYQRMISTDPDLKNLRGNSKFKSVYEAAFGKGKKDGSADKGDKQPVKDGAGK